MAISFSELAQRLGIKNLILYHTEDSNVVKRKELYTAEGSRFLGQLLVLDDREKIEVL